MKITNSISIDESELQIDFVQASGPGGQNVNKVATAVQLRFDVSGSDSLPEDAKARLIKLAGKRMTKERTLIIEAKRYRTQEANREDALARFKALVQKALFKPKKRKRTKPTRASKEKRLKEKKQRGELKKSRAKRKFEQD
jgi:ribosome-associated protein